MPTMDTSLEGQAPDAPQAEGAHQSCAGPKSVAAMVFKLEKATLGLKQDLQGLASQWQEAIQHSGESAVDHLTLYDSAAMDLEGKVQSAIVVGERFLGSCKGLHAEMRDLDILSARVKSVTAMLDELETVAKPLLK